MLAGAVGLWLALDRPAHAGAAADSAVAPAETAGLPAAAYGIDLVLDLDPSLFIGLIVVASAV